MSLFLTTNTEFSITQLKTKTQTVELWQLFAFPIAFPVGTEFLKYQDSERLTDRASYFYAEQLKHIFGLVFVDTYTTKILWKKAVKDSTILLLQLKPGKASNKYSLVIQVVQMKIRKT